MSESEHFLSAHPMGQPIEAQKVQAEVVDLLVQAYYAELETAMNYIAIVNNVDGFKGDTVRRLLEEDIQEEFGHALTIAQRIRTLGFTVPCGGNFRESSESSAQLNLGLAAVSVTSNVHEVLVAVQKAEIEAMNLYKKIIDMTKDYDPVTAGLITHILADEEEHFRSMQKVAKNSPEKAGQICESR